MGRFMQYFCFALQSLHPMAEIMSGTDISRNSYFLNTTNISALLT